MQSAKLGDEYQYDFTSPAFQTAFAFLKREDLADLPDGWLELENGVRASVQRYVTMDAQGLRFETHEKYFDIQFLAQGEERIGVVTRDGLTVRDVYNAKDDITFYEEPPAAGNVLLRAGEYVILCPEDAHKPRCMAQKPEPVLKIVVKVPK